MDDLFSRFFGDDEEWLAPRFSPRMDMADTDEAVLLRFDVPGIQPGEINLELRENRLTISGERKEEQAKEGETTLCCERRGGKFSRTITLPCPVKEDKIDAQYHDGVLTVTVPKAEAAKARKIEIKT
jgi:HSP20 family protein